MIEFREIQCFRECVAVFLFCVCVLCFVFVLVFVLNLFCLFVLCFLLVFFGGEAIAGSCQAVKMYVPPVRFELTTPGLRDQCTTTEL